MLKILYNLFKGVVMIFPYSAGVVIIRYELGVPKVLFMRTYNHWDFPKGGIEGSENKLQAAIREVEEETGIKDLNFRWGKVLYETEFYGKNHKKVSYFIAETKSTTDRTKLRNDENARIDAGKRAYEAKGLEDVIFKAPVVVIGNLDI